MTPTKRQVLCALWFSLIGVVIGGKGTPVWASRSEELTNTLAGWLVGALVGFCVGVVLTPYENASQQRRKVWCWATILGLSGGMTGASLWPGNLILGTSVGSALGILVGSAQYLYYLRKQKGMSGSV
jgi:hypothetical protein